MTQQNLSQIENDRQMMSYEQRQRAMFVLGILIEDFGLSPGRPPTELDAAVAVDQTRWRSGAPLAQPAPLRASGLQSSCIRRNTGYRTRL